MTLFAEYNDFIKVPTARKLYTLGSDLEWAFGRCEAKKPIIIKKGYNVDVSVPRLLEWAFDPHNNAHIRAAAVHDSLLEKGYARDFCSSEFRCALILGGVKPKLAWTAYFFTMMYNLFKWLSKLIKPKPKPKPK